MAFTCREPISFPPEERAAQKRTVTASIIVLHYFFHFDIILRLQLGSVFIHLSIHSQSSEVRRIAIQTIEAAVQSLPQLVISILREALTASLIKEKSAVVKNASVTEETEQPAPDNQRRCAALILCCGNKGEAGAGERDDQLVDLIVLAHHSAVCELPPSLPYRLLLNTLKTHQVLHPACYGLSCARRLAWTRTI